MRRRKARMPERINPQATTSKIEDRCFQIRGASEEIVLTAITIGLLLAQQSQQNPPITLPGTKPAEQPATAKSDENAAKPIVDVGTQSETILSITKHIAARYNPGNKPQNGAWAGGQQQDIAEGQLSFSMSNSTWGGKPCKYFQGRSDFFYRPNVKNKKVIFTPRLYVFAQLTPGGRLLHMSTAFNGFGTPVQIDATFNEDTIDIVKIDGADTTRSTLHPAFSMDLFDHLFDPFIRDGLVVAHERQIAFIHPISGAPILVTATLSGRFDGKHEYRSYQGYKIDVTSPDTLIKEVNFVTRHGQLLQVNLPENQDAIAYTHVSNVEERAWGKFHPSDWDKPASQTHPQRTLYRTLGIPILLTKPSYMLLPYPCAISL